MTLQRLRDSEQQNWAADGGLLQIENILVREYTRIYIYMHVYVHISHVYVHIAHVYMYTHIHLYAHARIPIV